MKLIRSLVLVFIFVSFFTGEALSQIEPPDRRYLYEGDRNFRANKIQQKQKSNQRRERIKQRSLSAGDKPYNIESSSLRYDNETQTLNADGELSLTYQTTVAEASRGSVNSATNDVYLEGDVRIEDLDFDLTADVVELNLNDETGIMKNARMNFDQGSYKLNADRINRVSKDSFVFEDVSLTTCECDEDCPPWKINASEARVEHEGYGEVWDATLNFSNIPVFYLPYLIFPVKNQRQSGFLPPTFGAGGQRGFELSAPFFWNIDDSTDATITSVLQTSSRVGLDVEFRKVLSKNSRVDAGVVYLNESLRGRAADGSPNLQGTVIDDYFDQTIDENRLGLYLNHNWQGEVAGIDFQWILDGSYVSDDFLPREYEKSEIALFNSRFVTSRAVARAFLTDTTTLDVSSEWNQAILDNDDLIFQRLPEVTLNSLNVFRPFGDNDYGLKLVSRSNLSYVNFDRKENFKGSRSELYQKLSVPFYYQNYLEGAFETSLRASSYSLSRGGTLSLANTSTGGTDEFLLDGSSNRVVPDFNFRLGTVFEKVYDVSDSSFLKAIHDVGRRGRAGQLKRFKHTIEPVARYQFVPNVDQDDNPLFDSFDRIAKRNVITYGVVQRLFSRTKGRSEYLYGIEEITPELQDLPSTVLPSPLEDKDRLGVTNPSFANNIFTPVRTGEIAELIKLEVFQSYDIDPEIDDPKTTSDNFSDLSSRLLFNPNEYLGFGFNSNFSIARTEFNSYSFDAQLRSKRGDRLLNRITFTNANTSGVDDIRQYESNLELVINDNLKFAYYGRYNDIDSSFIEQRGGFRVTTDCNCWNLDFLVGDRINPDVTELGFTLTLFGLGEFGNSFSRRR